MITIKDDNLFYEVETNITTGKVTHKLLGFDHSTISENNYSTDILKRVAGSKGKDYWKLSIHEKVEMLNGELPLKCYKINSNGHMSSVDDSVEEVLIVKTGVRANSQLDTYIQVPGEKELKVETSPYRYLTREQMFTLNKLPMVNKHNKLLRTYERLSAENEFTRDILKNVKVSVINKD